MGTVGAVALDRSGNLAAATSTGGVLTGYQLDRRIAARQGFAASNGCAFADRCPAVMPACRTKVPPSVPLPSGRRVACLLAGQPGARTRSQTEATVR